MLPIFQSATPDLTKVQTRWAGELNPLLNQPLIQGRLIQSIALTAGDNTINHGLGRPVQGWVVTRQRASASFYDTQDANPRPTLTLQLHASADANVDLWVF